MATKTKATKKESSVVTDITKMVLSNKKVVKASANESKVNPAKEYNKGLWSESSTQRYVERVEKDLASIIESGVVSDLHVYLAVGNKKTGTEVPSISLLPVVDCVNCEKCKLGCYDVHHDVINKDCYKYRLINSAIYRTDPDRFFKECYDVTRFVKTLRFCVGGDIKDMRFMRGLVGLANSRPDMNILQFTKNFDVVNRWMDEHDGNIPQNLKIMFSAWAGLEIPNPYRFPLSTIVLSNGTSFDETGKGIDTPVEYLCDGNCTNCHYDNKGCWVARRGTRVGINFHG